MSKEEDIQMTELLLSAMSGIDTNTSINNIERKGRDNILNKTQLPIYANTINGKYYSFEKENTKEAVREKYKEIGIEIINEENDLFYNVKLPKNLKLKSSESNYWTYLINNEGKELASIFYKAVFYDRDAFINIDW